MSKGKERLIAKEDAKQCLDQPPEIGLELLAQAIRYHRKKSSLTQQELAKLAGLGKTVIFDIEKGKNTVQLDSVLKVLQILNIEMKFSSPLMKIFLAKEVK
jgi:HTH-type transcriptional regulator / antitoxin HipB